MDTHTTCQKSITMLEGVINKRFLDIADANFLQLAFKISTSEDQQATIKHIFDDDISKCHYPFAGPLSSAYYACLCVIQNMRINNELENFNLINPVIDKDIALANLFLLVRKVMLEIHGIDIEVDRQSK